MMYLLHEETNASPKSTGSIKCESCVGTTGTSFYQRAMVLHRVYSYTYLSIASVWWWPQQRPPGPPSPGKRSVSSARTS